MDSTQCGICRHMNVWKHINTLKYNTDILFAKASVTDFLIRSYASIEFYYTIKKKSFADLSLFHILNSILPANFREMSN